MVDPHLSLLVSELNPQPDIRRQGFRSLLCQCRHNRDENLAFGIKGVYVFFLEKDVDSHAAELMDDFDAVDRVPGKATKWLESLGFHVGDMLQVEYEEGSIRISPAIQPEPVMMVAEPSAGYGRKKRK